MFRGDGQSVEENQEDDQPIKNLGFDGGAALPPEQPVPSSGVTTEEERQFFFIGYKLKGRTSRRVWDGAK